MNITKIGQAVQGNRVLAAMKDAVMHVSGVQMSVGLIIFIFTQVTLYIGVDETIQLFLLRIFQTYCTGLGFAFAYITSKSLEDKSHINIHIAIFASLFGVLLLSNDYVVEFPLFVLLIAPWIHSLYSRLMKLEFSIKSAPEAVSKTLSGVLMNLLMLLFVLVLIFVFDGFILSLVRGLVVLTYVFSHPVSIVLIVVLVGVFWNKGIHGMDVMGRLIRPFWFMMILANMQAVLSHQSIPYIGSETFYQWTVFIGGSGCTIGLAILARYFSRSIDMKVVGKEAWSSSWFNINEPIIFGVPTMENPYFKYPFILAPVLCSLIAYLAFAGGFVTVPSVGAPWVLPAPLGIFIATLGDFRSLLLMFVLILTSLIIYLPFFIKYDRHMKNNARH